MSTENIRPRACLSSLPAYVPGEPAPDDGVTRYKVSSNESPFGPVPAVLDAAVAAMAGINRYPDMGVVALRERVAEAFSAQDGAPQVDPSQIVVSSGSVAVSGDLVRALVDQGDEVVYAWRSFEAYPILVGSHGGTAVPVPLTASLEHDLDAMAAAITERTKLVLLCTPNNPSGPALSTEQVEAFLAQVPDTVVVALDEAYREFADPERRLDSARIFAAHPNVVILRTFSKMQGLAGLRIGYAVAHPVLARAMNQVTVPFGANLVAQAAALATFEPDVAAELERRAAWIRGERRRVLDALAAQGWTLPDSQGNFVHLDLAERSGEFAAFADARGLVVRAYGNDGVRITIGEEEATARLIRRTPRRAPASPSEKGGRRSAFRRVRGRSRPKVKVP